MENTNYTVDPLPGGVKVLRGEGYEYRIDKRIDGKPKWTCTKNNFSATASTVNDDIEKVERGQVDHNHRPDKKVQKKITDTYPLLASSSRGAEDTDQNTDGNLKHSRSMTDRHMDESDNDGNADDGSKAQISSEESLESNSVGESGTESEESSDGDINVRSSPKKSVKFVPMNLYKLKPFPSELKNTAEEIISKFIDTISKRLDRKRKATQENVNSGQAKKIRTSTNQNEDTNSETEREFDETAERRCSENEKQHEGDMENQEKDSENEMDIANVDRMTHSENEEFIQTVHDGNDSENEDIIESVDDGNDSENEDIIESVDDGNVSENEDIIESVDDGNVSENEDIIESIDDGNVSENEETFMFKPQELRLTPDTKRLLSGHPSNFKLKLYRFSTPSLSQMTRAVSNIVSGPTYDYMNTNRSFIFLFYREQNNGDPEIYVMTSGQVFRRVEMRACTRFPDKIARRILKFKSIEIVTRNVTGDTSKTSKLFLPNSEGTFNIWDLITAIVNKYTAFPKENSSLYSLKCFQKKKGQPKEVTLSIKEKSVTVNQSTSMEDLLDIVNHFADIDQGKPTKLQKRGSNKGEQERDDPQFDQMNYIQRVSNRKALKTLNENLDKRIQRLLKGTGPNEDLSLSMEKMHDFVHAETYFLFITMKRKPVCKWSGKPPMLSEILKKVHRHLSCRKSLITMNWLKRFVKISLKESNGRRYPVTQCLVQGYICSSEPYFLWHGKWLKIELEYQVLINKNFHSILDENTIKAEVILPLPWVNKPSKQNGNKDENKSKFKLKEFVSFLDILGNSIMTNASAKTMLSRLGKYDEVKGICIYKLDDYGAELYKKDQNDNGAKLDQRHPEDNGGDLDQEEPEDNGAELDQEEPEDNGGDLDQEDSEDNGAELDQGDSEDNGAELDQGDSEDNGAELYQGDSEDNGAELDKGDSEDNGAELDQGDQSAENEAGKNVVKPNDCNDDSDFNKADLVLSAKIFLRLHATLSEFNFNKTYLLLDKLLRQHSREKGFIVSDRLLGHNIELFDVLAYNKIDTYLVHVKTGFNHNVRELCSQVRNSADQLFSDLTASKSYRIIDQWWDTLNKPIQGTKEMAKYKKAVQESCSVLGKKGFQNLFQMPRGITYVLAIKDTRRENSALCYDQGSTESCEKDIKEAVGDHSGFVLEKLKEKKYVTKNSSVSDKFTMKAAEFVNEMFSGSSSTTAKMQESVCNPFEISSDSEDDEDDDDAGTKEHTLSKKDWGKVYKALKKHFPKTRSTVLQMELLHLFSYFRRYQLGTQKFQLKICFIPDSNTNLGKDLKSFLDPKT